MCTPKGSICVVDRQFLTLNLPEEILERVQGQKVIVHRGPALSDPSTELFNLALSRKQFYSSSSVTICLRTVLFPKSHSVSPVERNRLIRINQTPDWQAGSGRESAGWVYAKPSTVENRYSGCFGYSIHLTFDVSGTCSE